MTDTTGPIERLSGVYDVTYWPDDSVYMMHEVDSDSYFMVQAGEMKETLSRYYTDEQVKTLMIQMSSCKTLRVIPTEKKAAVKQSDPIDATLWFMQQHMTPSAVQRVIDASEKRIPIEEDEALGQLIRD